MPPDHQASYEPPPLPLGEVRLLFDAWGKLLDAIVEIDGDQVARLPLLAAHLHSTANGLGHWDLSTAALYTRHETTRSDG